MPNAASPTLRIDWAPPELRVCVSCASVVCAGPLGPLRNLFFDEVFRWLRANYRAVSNRKMRFQSFFMMMTTPPLASSESLGECARDERPFWAARSSDLRARLAGHLLGPSVDIFLTC
jgi:hypothetical protein